LSYKKPKNFVKDMIESGESKVFMSTSDTLVRAYMAGAILALAAVFAITVSVTTGSSLLGAVLFPVGFIILYLMGFDLLTGVFVLIPLALLDKREGVTFNSLMKNWALVFIGNLLGSLTVAFMMSFVFTYGYQVDAGVIGNKIALIGESRTIGYSEHGIWGWFTILIRGMLCGWMVSIGIVGSMIATTVTGKAFVMWMPIMIFFFMGFEHSIVNMFLFPFSIIMGGNFTVVDYIVWNELPTIIGNLLGGLIFTVLTLYATHHDKNSKVSDNLCLK
jgi:formate/nitrite transporter